MSPTVTIPLELARRLVMPDITTGHNPEDWYGCRTCETSWTSKSDDPGPQHEEWCPIPELERLIEDAERLSGREVRPYEVQVGGRTQTVVRVGYTRIDHIPVKTLWFRDGGCACMVPDLFVIYQNRPFAFTYDSSYFLHRERVDISEQQYEDLLRPLQDGNWKRRFSHP